MACKRCGQEKEIYIARRGLCRACYIWLREKHCMDLYPKEKFPSKHRYQDKYPGIELYLKQLKSDTSTTLQSLADRYGVSRERIRQVYKELLGVPYTDCLSSKAKTRKVIARAKKKIKREQFRQDIYLRFLTYSNGQAKMGTFIEWLVYQRCLDLGYNVSVGDTRIVDLTVNGLRVEVKSRHREPITTGTSKILYYLFNIRAKQNALADYFVLYVAPKNEFYVIPNDRKGVMKSRLIHIPEHETYTPSSKHDIPKYLEAWHLLANETYFEKNITDTCISACN